MKKLFNLLLMTVIYTVGVSAQSFSVIESSSAVYAKGISSDGKYVVGQVGSDQDLKGNYTFIWTREDGLITLNPENMNRLNEGNSALNVSLTGRAVGVAPDPNRVVDTYESYQLPLITAAYRDLGAGTWKILPLTTTNTLHYGFGSVAYAISDDGNIIVGGQTPGGQAGRYAAGYWDVSDPDAIVFHELSSETKAGYGSSVTAISGDGRVMGGYENIGWNPYTTLWIDGVKSAIPGSGGGAVTAISKNGRYAVFQNGSNIRANLYDIEKGELIKFDLNTFTPTPAGYSTPRAVSDNGIVVGHWGNNTFLGGDLRQAFIYAKTLGMVSLADFLTGAGGLGIDFQGINFLEATGISADGRIITGFGMKGGKAVSFLLEIPELPNGIEPVQNVFVDSPSYRRIVLSWETPETVENGPVITAYKIYTDNNVLLETVNSTVHSYVLDNVADGTYHYSIQAVYADEGTTKEAVASKTVTITTGKKTLPFFDDFSDYQPGGAVVEVMEILEEIPLSTGYWDVSANTVPFKNSWRVYESGYPHWCAYFLAPAAGEYNESLTSPYLDASQLTDLILSFNVRSQSGSHGTLAVEMYDGAEWSLIANIPVSGREVYEFKKYPVNNYAGKDNIRVRFRAYGNNGTIRWFVDNVELTDNARQIPVEEALVIAARTADETVHVNWSDPTGYVKLRYMWDDNVYYGAIGNEKLPFIAANMYPAEDLTAYEGYKLTSISFWRTTNPDPSAPMRNPVFRWFVSQGGERLYSAPVTTDNFKWNTVELDEPVAIDVTKPLYYGVEVVECDPQDWPIGSGTFYSLNSVGGMDMVIADGRGNIYSEDNGTTWRKLSDEGPMMAYDLFSIRATLAKDPAVQPKERIRGYQILRNGEKLLDPILYGTNMLVELNNFTDLNPLPVGEEACYTVKIYYMSQVFSNGVTACITRVNGINLIQGENGLKVYPNKIQKGETITVELSGNWNESTIAVYDLSGKNVKTVKATGEKTPVPLDLEAGVYVLKVDDKDAVKLIVK
ncbi:MAG: T9SS type A sorting domain-containing protein [Candidatus Symbiothrix sp.]|jgi:uncharacterized membrane protein|nr:T9SS type A sorting domain-containing protein [Candidatus Symbiothrix sp.]